MSEEEPPVQMDVLRRYMALRCAHLIPRGRMEEGHLDALCGAVPTTFWRGGNGPEEIRVAQNLPICRNCVRILGSWCPAW